MFTFFFILSLFLKTNIIIHARFTHHIQNDNVHPNHHHLLSEVDLNSKVDHGRVDHGLFSGVGHLLFSGGGDVFQRSTENQPFRSDENKGDLSRRLNDISEQLKENNINEPSDSLSDSSGGPLVGVVRSPTIGSPSIGSPSIGSPTIGSPSIVSLFESMSVRESLTKYFCESSLSLSSDRTNEECRDICLRECSIHNLSSQELCLRDLAKGCQYTRYKVEKIFSEESCVKTGGLWRFHFDTSGINWPKHSSELFLNLNVQRRPYEHIVKECKFGSFQIMPSADALTIGVQMCQAGRYPANRGISQPFNTYLSPNIVSVDLTDWSRREYHTISTYPELSLVLTGCCSSQLSKSQNSAFIEIYIEPIDILAILTTTTTTIPSTVTTATQTTAPGTTTATGTTANEVTPTGTTANEVTGTSATDTSQPASGTESQPVGATYSNSLSTHLQRQEDTSSTFSSEIPGGDSVLSQLSGLGFIYVVCILLIL